jgi:hypothetical protein
MERMDANEWLEQAERAVDKEEYDKAQALTLMAIAVRLGAIANKPNSA